MTEHNGTVPCGERVNCKLRDVVQHEEMLTPRTNHCGIRQLPRPGLNIDVAAHRMGRGEVPQLLKHFSTSDVPRMDDEVRTSECRNRLRTQQSVRIRNDTEAHSKGSSDTLHHATITLLNNYPRKLRELLCIRAHTYDGVMV